VKFGVATFMEKLSINAKIVYNRSKYRALYVKTKAGFIVTGYFISARSEMLLGC